MDSARCVARGLRKAFGDLVAVDDVSFHIDSGEVYGLLGPNGAGKTTTISLVVGLLARDGGDVSICGDDIDAGAKVRAHIGYVPQEIALYTELTAAENLRFWGRMYGLGGSELNARVAEVLDLVGLAERAGDRVQEYSGGMQRRLNIAAGMMHRPELLILDEPTVGVDPQSRNAILTDVERLGASGMAVLYTTHYMEEAERLCDRVGIMDSGRLIAEGTRRELIGSIGEDDRIVIGFDHGTDLSAATDVLNAVAGVRGVTVDGAEATVLASDGRVVLAHAVRDLSAAGLGVAAVELQEPDLESVFLHLTGRALRD
ncbi:MAG: ABC transporter ATP-binding protein [Acidimicrobiia bacterium]|nr:ABC transporter ATP-binding protein [Acidimicrobiia bacterium]